MTIESCWMLQSSCYISASRKVNLYLRHEMDRCQFLGYGISFLLIGKHRHISYGLWDLQTEFYSICFGHVDKVSCFPSWSLPRKIFISFSLNWHVALTMTHQICVFRMDNLRWTINEIRNDRSPALTAPSSPLVHLVIQC